MDSGGIELFTIIKLNTIIPIANQGNDKLKLL